ncbi:HAMP domain-containing histidine kinase [Nocardioidaceae bacterium]|nr:HAMP domain-containing histidine kinase [Nocardioidaceae bacterium]
MDGNHVLRQQVVDAYLAAHPPCEPLPGHEDLVALAVHIAAVPGAAINLLTEHEQVVVASSSLEAGETFPLEDSLCHRVVEGGLGETQVPDLAADARFADSGFVSGRLAELRFYAGFPLRTPGGVDVGTLCVFDEQEQALDSGQVEALTMLARRVVDLYELSVRERELSSAAEALTAQAEALSRTNRTLDAFTGQIGHDLKGPVASLRMSLGMLAENDAVLSDSDAAWLSDTAVIAARRLGTMVEDCLEFARHGGRLQRRPVDLAALVAGVESDLSAQLDGIDLVRGQLPVVHADASQLVPLVQNLVANAAKFLAGVREPVVRVSAVTTGRDGFRLEIADNGPGVPEADRARVFDTHWQGSHEVPGLGLGLATCQRIAEAHGGRMTVGAAPEGGALFALVVPPRARTTAQVPSQPTG